MRRIEKKQDSEIIIEKLFYKENGSKNNKKIREILEKEQLNFCAFTEEYFTTAFTRSVEHFNPYLKDTPEDNYENWFVVSQRFNEWKGTKNAKSRWDEYQPIISLADEGINEIIYFDNGDYIVHPSNVEATNLLKLLHINHSELRESRKKYMKRLTIVFSEMLNNDKKAFEKYLLAEKEAGRLSFPTAIKATFGIDILNP